MKAYNFVLFLTFCSIQIFSQDAIGLLYVSSIETTICEKPKLSHVLCPVYKYDTLRVIDSTKKYYKVKYDHYTGTHMGYLLKNNLYSWGEYLKKNELPQNEVQAKELTKLQKRFGKTKGLMIFNGIVWIGMTEEEALLSMGEPTNRVALLGTWGSQKRFIYARGGYLKSILTLYFENGVLTYHITNPH